jgi:hypothetical protein
MSEKFEGFRDTVNIVSGLPRSGTSMMMKMLEAGGIEALIDNIRKADVDNPKGYYEYERVKEIKEDQEWLGDAVGRVVKMVSMLLLDLPEGYKYKIVFMRRDLHEVLKSQRKMLDRIDKPQATGPQADAEDRIMMENYRKHLLKVHFAMEKRNDVELLYVKYNDFLENPEPHVKTVNEFFDGTLDEDRMKTVVDPKLYRNRNK